MDGRVFTEAKMKADELLTSLDEALTLCGDQLEQEEQEQISAAKQAVLDAIEANNGAQLKAATELLDDATELLASLIMQSLLEQ